MIPWHDGPDEGRASEAVRRWRRPISRLSGGVTIILPRPAAATFPEPTELMTSTPIPVTRRDPRRLVDRRAETPRPIGRQLRNRRPGRSCATLVAIVGMSLGGIAIGGCGEQAGTGAPAPPTVPSQVVEVDVSTSIMAPVRRQLGATGTLFPDEETLVAAKVTGRIIELRADLGDEVDAGTLLAQIDPIDAELALQERRLALAEALAQLGLDPDDPGALASVDTAHVDGLPAVQRARRQADNTRARLERSEVLLAQDPPLISAQDHADLQTAWEVAEQDHQLALLSSRATLARAQTLTAQVASAERVLADTRVIAPEGIAPPLPAEFESLRLEWDRERLWSIAERYVGVGTLVQPGSPLFRLVDTDPLKLRVPVPEHRIAQVALGARAVVRGEGSTVDAHGRVLRISPVVDPRTRTFGVEIIVPNPDRTLRPGGFARAAIQAAMTEDALLVPADAIVVFAGVEKIFVVDGEIASERRVETGASFGTLVEVLRGLDADQTVIRRPSPSLIAGTPVRVAERVAITPPPTGQGG